MYIYQSAVHQGLTVQSWIKDCSFIRFRYNESDSDTLIPFLKVGGIAGPKLELYDEKSTSKMTFKWSPQDVLPEVSEPPFSPEDWSHDSQAIVQGNVVVFLFKSGDCFREEDTALLAAAKFEPGDEYLTSLWHQFSDQPTSWWIVVIQDKIYR